MKDRIIRIITIALAPTSIVVFQRVAQAFKVPDLYKKDFIQFYLMGKASLAGSSIYAPIPDLAARFDPNLGSYHWHPAAYPPSMLLFMAPLSLLSYESALKTWVIVEILCFFLSALLILRHFGGRSAPALLPLVIILMILWPPFFIDLYQGQTMMLVLLILTLLWLSLRSEQEVVGGLLLGLLLSMKLYAWPIMVLLLVQRKLRPAVIATLVSLLAIVGAMGWLGVETVISYYFRVGPEIGVIYLSHPLNFSILAFAAQYVSNPFTVLTVLMLVIVSVWLSLRAPDFDHSFMIMLVISSVVNPVAWPHYFVTFLLPFSLIATRRRFSKAELLGLTAIVCTSAPEVYESLLSPQILRAIRLIFVMVLLMLLARVFSSKNATRREIECTLTSIATVNVNCQFFQELQ